MCVFTARILTVEVCVIQTFIFLSSRNTKKGTLYKMLLLANKPKQKLMGKKRHKEFNYQTF